MNANAPDTDAAGTYDPDHTIDRALSALRDAQPRSGLNGRILTALDHRATAQQTTRFRISAHIALWAATSAALIAIASLAILHHHATPANLARAPQSNLTSNTTDTAQLHLPAIARQRISTAPALSIGRHPERSVAQRRTPVSTDAATPNTDGITPTDAQALADLHAPSHPAPPLPLTPQERLFLHILRYGNVTELAELDPMVRAKQDADETAAFKAFFPDPPPLKQPGDTE